MAKVLVCIPCLLVGGTEVQTLSLVKALVSGGHKVTVACYFEHTSEMVRRYGEAGATVELLSPEGVRPQGIKATTKLLYRGLKRIVRTDKPDVAHVQYMAPGAIPIILLKLLGVKKILATSHTAADIYSRNGIRLIRLLTHTCLDGFQCITLKAEESYYGSSRMFDGTLSRHFTIYNSLPEHITIRETPRPQLGPSDTVTIGVVSRLERIKGMDLVIPAFTRVAAKHDNVRLLIVGDGSLRETMERQAEESGFADRIEFAGRKTPEELQDWYDKIDILLMPSRSEGFGLTAIEGMARGCVPVVSNVGGLPEVVRDGLDGILHQPDSVEDMADKLYGLISDKSSLSNFSRMALNRSNAFSDKFTTKVIMELYGLMESEVRGV